MPSRLDDLRRQRALVKEQLDWIDREIAALGAPPAEPPSAPAKLEPVFAPPPAASRPPIPVAAPSRPRAAPSLSTDFSQYETDPASVQQAAKRGCLTYAIVGFVLFIGTLVTIYFVAYRDRPVLFATPKAAPAASPSK